MCSTQSFSHINPLVLSVTLPLQSLRSKDLIPAIKIHPTNALHVDSHGKCSKSS